MGLYEEFKNLKINHDLIGLEQRENAAFYECTPKGAHIIGWAGVDGIHYCTIEGHGETVFAVSPMDFDDCVHPIARSFRDLLSLLLTCGHMAALDQCHAWTRDVFQSFLRENPVLEEQQQILNCLQKTFHLEPIEDVFAYVKNLQEAYAADISAGNIKEDSLPNAADAVTLPEWKVTFEGDFWGSEGKSGREIVLRKEFYWDGHRWIIPSIYLFRKGIVIDFLTKITPEHILQFRQKWEDHDSVQKFTQAEEAAMERENPLNLSFSGNLLLGGKEIRPRHGCGDVWVPDICRRKDEAIDPAAYAVLKHYDLDEKQGWVMNRWSFPAELRTDKIPSNLSVILAQNPDMVEGAHFVTPNCGSRVTCSCPNGENVLLSILNMENIEAPENAFPDSSMEYPRQCLKLTYEQDRDVRMFLRDTSVSDSPRRRQKASDYGDRFASCGIIGGADGPTVMMMHDGKKNAHTVCSALHFEPVDRVEWCPVFPIKTAEDIEISLL